MSRPTFLDQPPSAGGEQHAVITHRDALVLNNETFGRISVRKRPAKSTPAGEPSKKVHSTRQSGNGVTPPIYE